MTRCRDEIRTYYLSDNERMRYMLHQSRGTKNWTYMVHKIIWRMNRSSTNLDNNISQVNQTILLYQATVNNPEEKKWIEIFKIFLTCFD